MQRWAFFFFLCQCHECIVFIAMISQKEIFDLTFSFVPLVYPFLYFEFSSNWRINTWHLIEKLELLRGTQFSLKMIMVALALLTKYVTCSL